MNILFFVNHLLGVGHLQRVCLLAKGLMKSHHVRILSGGLPVPALTHDLDLVQLPPLSSADTEFRGLLTPELLSPDENYVKLRQTLIRKTVMDFQPDCLITEHFPFGRGKLKQDFMTFMDAGLSLKKRPIIAASVRDILIGSAKKPDFSDLPYDLILIHGDEALRPEWSFIKGPKLAFTGYVYEKVPPKIDLQDKIVVVAGGRNISQKVQDSLQDIIKEGTDQFVIRAPSPPNPANNCVYVDFIPELASKLAHAKLVISEAGYNSVLSSLTTQVPTVFIPFSTPTEDEQIKRLRSLQVETWAEMILPEDLTPEHLRTAMQNVLTKKREYPQLNLEGVRNAQKAIEKVASRFFSLDSRRSLSSGLTRDGNDKRSGIWDKIKTLLDQYPDLTFWWRDDDLIKPTVQGDRMLHLSKKYQIPVTLAVIPELAEDSLRPWLDESQACYTIVQHGASHINYGDNAHKRCELVKGFDVDRLQQGKDKLAELFPQNFKPMMVPPWNRFDPSLQDFLTSHYKKISIFGKEENENYLNTHLDFMIWKDEKRCITPEEIYKEVKTLTTHVRPLGLLTHHLVQGETHWETLEKLFQFIGKDRFIDPGLY